MDSLHFKDKTIGVNDCLPNSFSFDMDILADFVRYSSEGIEEEIEGQVLRLIRSNRRNCDD